MTSAFRGLELGKDGGEINGTGTNITLLFQFINTNQEQVLSLRS